MSLPLVGAAFFLPAPGDWNWAGTSRSGLGHHRIISLAFHLSIFPLLGMVFNPHSNLLLSHPPSPIPHRPRPRPRPRPQSPAPKLRHFCFQDGDPQPNTTTTPLIHRRFHPLRLADSWRPALLNFGLLDPRNPPCPPLASSPGFLAGRSQFPGSREDMPVGAAMHEASPDAAIPLPFPE